MTNPNLKSLLSTNVLRSKTNNNALITNRRTQRMRLHMMCRAILTNSNVEENLLNRLEVSYERACMATPRDEYYTNILEMPVNYNDCNNELL